MKKILSLLLCMALTACFFAGCSKGDGKSAEQEKFDSLMPSESTNYDELIPIYEFAGTYANDDYTVLAEQESDQILKFTVTTNTNENGKGYEWQMAGYFSDQTYRVHYTEAVKYAVTFDKNGAETDRTAEYENGSGTMQFTDNNKLFWENNSERLDGSLELARVNN